ncbi:hypothetical protein [Pedobacter hartonius]|uniref:Uncharacterized protein n=1 Tax=Pedobacter hartonius TaxID=425514 RepID=A0A1H4HG35_9SPHI|nr:hypothetical protein [Pedobacter hartonius]SEB20651.1 hypothetical protein SAMN05443550_11720 [Pedobacter hartonius]
MIEDYKKAPLDLYKAVKASNSFFDPEGIQEITDTLAWHHIAKQ